MDNKKVTPITRINKSYKLYGLYCPYTGELRYIGITTGLLSTRLSGHFRKPTNGKIALWFKKLKNDKFIPIIKLIREYGSYEELLNGEITEIKLVRAKTTNLLNIGDGGDINPMFGKTHTVEARKKISVNNKGLKRNDKQKSARKDLLTNLWSNDEWAEKLRLKMSQNMLNNKRALGLKHSTFSKLLMSDAHRGNKNSLGYKHSDETKNKMSKNNSGVNNPMYGKSLPYETLIKRSLKVKKEGTFKGEKNPNFKHRIAKNDLYSLFIDNNLTIKQIAEQYNCSVGVINDNLRLFKINKPKSNKYNLNIVEISKMLLEGLSQVEIARRYGCGNKYINKIIKNKLKHYG